MGENTPVLKNVGDDAEDKEMATEHLPSGMLQNNIYMHTVLLS